MNMVLKIIGIRASGLCFARSVYKYVANNLHFDVCVHMVYPRGAGSRGFRVLKWFDGSSKYLFAVFFSFRNTNNFGECRLYMGHILIIRAPRFG